QLADHNAFPQLPALTEFRYLGDDRTNVGGFFDRSGHQPGDRAAVAREPDLFSACNAIEKLGKVGLRLEGANGFHAKLPACDWSNSTSLTQLAQLDKQD